MSGTVAMAWVLPGVMYGQTPDTLKPFTLPPATISVTRAELLLSKAPLAVQTVDRRQISLARPTWGLDEALFSVPGVFAANRYNFSVDQRISIRGFGSRSAFAIRGIKVLLDGIPQTLPDGQGQLTNLELGAADRIEVLRGSSSALFGNAAGGVISIWTRAGPPPEGRALAQELRVVGGTFDRGLDRTWTKWQSMTHLRVGGAGSALLTVARLAYEGERDHSAADLRSINARFQTPLRSGWTLTANADVGDQPRADNPGALTLAELRANRDSAPAINLSTQAGKDVTQAQGGVTLRRQLDHGEAVVTLFGLTRDLENPTTFAYIQLGRRAYGARASLTHPIPLGRMPHRLTVGLDFQRQRDDRRNFGNAGGAPDTSARALDQLEHVTEIGPFAQSVLELSRRATLTAGVRYDRVGFRVQDRLVNGTNPDDSGERLMDAVSGSFGIALNPADAVTVYGNIASSFETPTTTELANRPSGAGGFNDSLGPQRAWSYEVGARGAEAFAGRLKWSVALFVADVRDELISYEVPSAPQRRFFRNAGTARHRGIEVGADALVAPGVSVAGAWTYSDFRYRDYRFTTPSGPVAVLDGRELPGIPKHRLQLALRARPAALRGGWVEIETMHSAAYFVDDTLTTRTTPWWHTNLRVGWEGTAGRVRIGPFVGFNNVFNRHYVGSVVINAARGRYYEPAPGRNLYVGFSIGADASAPLAALSPPAPIDAPPTQAIDSSWLASDVATRTATFQLIAGLTGLNAALNFNGFPGGGLTLTVPLGWNVVMNFSNNDRDMPHSAEVIEDQRPLPPGPVDPAFPRAATIRLAQGLDAGETDDLRFVADRAGSFLIFCAVPGHGLGGMWIRFKVSATAARPGLST